MRKKKPASQQDPDGAPVGGQESSAAISSAVTVQPCAAQPIQRANAQPQRRARVPNLYWNAVRMDDLRDLEPRFVALPPEGAVDLQCAHSFRFLRQDESLWWRMHRGVLTTGSLADFLGFREQGSASVLRISRHQVGHHHQLSACVNLRQPHHPQWHNTCCTPQARQDATAPAAHTPAPTFTFAGAGPAAVASEATAADAAVARLVFGAHGTKGAASLSAASKGGPSPSPKPLSWLPHTTGSHRVNVEAVRRHSTAAVTAAEQRGSLMACDKGRACPKGGPLTAEEERHCVSVGRGGVGGVKMAWGSAQEATALHALTQLMHESTLHEVGLMAVSPDELPPPISGSATWRFPSPPAPATPTPEQQALAAVLGALGGCSLGPDTNTQPPAPPQATVPAAASGKGRGGGAGGGRGRAGSRPGSAPVTAAPSPPSLPLPFLGASPDGIICHRISGVPKHTAEWIAATAATCHPSKYAYAAGSTPASVAPGSCSCPYNSIGCAGDTTPACCSCHSAAGVPARTSDGGTPSNSSTGNSGSRSGTGSGAAGGAAGAVGGEPAPAAPLDPQLRLNLSFSLMQAVQELLSQVPLNNHSEGDPGGGAGGREEEVTGSGAEGASAGRGGGDAVFDGGDEAGDRQSDGGVDSEFNCSEFDESSSSGYGSAAQDDCSVAAAAAAAAAAAVAAAKASLIPRGAALAVSSAAATSAATAVPSTAGKAAAVAASPAPLEPHSASGAAGVALPGQKAPGGKDKGPSGRLGQGQTGAPVEGRQGFTPSMHESIAHVFLSKHPVVVLPDGSETTVPPNKSAVALGAGAASADGADDGETRTVLIREVVEIKCHCPFSDHHGSKPPKRATAAKEWRVSDQGPYEYLSPIWVLQLQLHMLASGCWSALLVSFSATKGMRVFRMFRDDHYLSRLLSLVSRLYRAHVLSHRDPPANLFSKETEYHGFLHHTMRLARTAKLVAAVPPGSSALRPRARSDTAFV